MGRVNHFLGEDTAERYACSRPYFHPLVVRRISKTLGHSEPVSGALDVACGTGQSTVSLTEIASQVVGSDSSVEMLSRATRHDRVEYIEASAEDLLFENESFDLLTVALAFHWFDRDLFLSEARRVLRPAGWLIVYDNRFLGRMKENTAFESWVRESYAARYPSPPRDGRPISNEEAQRHGFVFTKSEEYKNDVRFSVEELAGYLKTHSNVVSAVEKVRESLSEAHEGLVESLRDLFPGSVATFEFGGDIRYLKAEMG